ncbi:prolipoprotein diacylglyceryl transferase family protein [Sorangium sp. So ce406]|uniref:prolipoprotein diacylglyceryl transferase family protein n=1 Tax=Sorangium sp. So ce406 TaxID=3133311 RepID=UPI003F5B92AD
MSRASGGLNAWLDGLPRPALFRACQPRPTFLGMGAAGYYAALVVTLGAGLVAGRSLLVLSALSAACAASFFGWALLRKWITGHESYVLMEHLWVAQLSCAGALLLLREPVLPHLDTVSLGLCAFLAAGRLGCLLVGCCHGMPSSVGIVYGEELVRGGFPKHLAGVRLFPVQLVEAAALAAIGLIGLLLLPASPPGHVLAWVLLSYAIVRFGLEGIRGDDRPHLLGLSQSRWMAALEAAAAIALSDRGSPMSPARWAAAGAVAAVLLAALAVRARRAALARRLLSAAHVGEVRELVRAAAERVAAPEVLDIVGVPPEVRPTRLGVSVGVSPLESGGRSRAHVSLMLPLGAPDLRLACALAARALPEATPPSAHASPLPLLHVVVPLPLQASPTPRADLSDALFGAAVRRLQERALPAGGGPRAATLAGRDGGDPDGDLAPAPLAGGSRARRQDRGAARGDVAGAQGQAGREQPAEPALRAEQTQQADETEQAASERAVHGGAEARRAAAAGAEQALDGHAGGFDRVFDDVAASAMFTPWSRPGGGDRSRG